MRAVIVLVVAIALGPQSASAQTTSNAYFEFLSARQFESDGDNQGALAALERAAAADPASAEVRAEIASFYLRRGQRADAERAAKEALALDEHNVEANRTLGMMYAAAVESATQKTPPEQTLAALRDAVLHLERAVAGQSTVDARLSYTLGRLYIRTGAPDKAIPAFVRVLGQNPDSVEARLALADAYALAKDLPNAIGTLDGYVEDEPRLASALGQYQEQAGRMVDAAASYTLALSVQPGSRNLKFRRIAALYAAKQFGQAAGFAADARKQHPDDPRFARLQARALFDAGDRSGGLAVIESAAKANPRDTATQLALVDLYHDAGRSTDAEKVLRQIIADEPSNAGALNYLGYMLATRGEQLEEAIRLVRRALDSDPDNGSYLDSLGWAHFRRGDLAEAEKYLAAAAERLPENSEVQDHLGDVFARRSRWTEAIAAWTKAIDGDGDDVDKTAIQKKISDARAKLRP